MKDERKYLMVSVEGKEKPMAAHLVDEHHKSPDVWEQSSADQQDAHVEDHKEKDDVHAIRPHADLRHI